jgi:hypothetical protein
MKTKLHKPFVYLCLLPEESFLGCDTKHKNPALTQWVSRVEKMDLEEQKCQVAKDLWTEYVRVEIYTRDL